MGCGNSKKAKNKAKSKKRSSRQRRSSKKRKSKFSRRSSNAAQFANHSDGAASGYPLASPQPLASSHTEEQLRRMCSQTKTHPVISALPNTTVGITNSNQNRSPITPIITDATAANEERLLQTELSGGKRKTPKGEPLDTRGRSTTNIKISKGQSQKSTRSKSLADQNMVLEKLKQMSKGVVSKRRTTNVGTSGHTTKRASILQHTNTEDEQKLPNEESIEKIRQIITKKPDVANEPHPKKTLKATVQELIRINAMKRESRRSLNRQSNFKTGKLTNSTSQVGSTGQVPKSPRTIIGSVIEAPNDQPSTGHSDQLQLSQNESKRVPPEYLIHNSEDKEDDSQEDAKINEK